MYRTAPRHRYAHRCLRSLRRGQLLKLLLSRLRLWLLLWLHRLRARRRRGRGHGLRSPLRLLLLPLHLLLHDPGWRRLKLSRLLLWLDVLLQLLHRLLLTNSLLALLHRARVVHIALRSNLLLREATRLLRLLCRRLRLRHRLRHGLLRLCPSGLLQLLLRLLLHRTLRLLTIVP